MDVHSMIDRACGDVGIRPPRDHAEGRWLVTDTVSGKNGKGDGRVKIEADHVIAWNWQTGERSTVRAGAEQSPGDRRRAVERIQKSRHEQRERAARAAVIAQRLISHARPGTHPYLAGKGFPADMAPILATEDVAAIAGRYLVPDGAARAIVIPARVRDRLTSCQLVWEDGTKKFLFGGEMGGATFRVAPGRDTWLCEGYATGLSLRAVLRSMNRRDGILCCFSAQNLAAVAPSVPGRLWIAADCDKPLEQYGGLGTGEHYARMTRRPYALPADVGTDINDMHIGHGLYAVQRLLGETIRGAPNEGR